MARGRLTALNRMKPPREGDFNKDLMEWRAPDMQLSEERVFQVFIHNKMPNKITFFLSVAVSVKTTSNSLMPLR